jgi:hypothetical protein
MSDEQYVRSRLDDVYWDKRFFNVRGDIVHLGWSICDAETEENGWELAAAWTRQREEEIRQVQRDIEWASECFDVNDVLKMAKLNTKRPDVAVSWTRDHCAHQRILGRLQAALKELQRSMKEQHS